MDPYVISLPIETHDHLHDLARRTSKTEILRRLLRAYQDQPLIPPDTAPKRTSFSLDEADVAIIDEIQRKNGLKSKTQAVTLLIEAAWQESQP